MLRGVLAILWATTSAICQGGAAADFPLGVARQREPTGFVEEEVPSPPETLSLSLAQQPDLQLPKLERREDASKDDEDDDGDAEKTTFSTWIDSTWSIAAVIGNPPRKFVFTLDTTSSNLVAGTALYEDTWPDAPHSYDPDVSHSSSSTDGYSYTCTSEDCHAATAYRDSFTVGNLTVRGQYFQDLNSPNDTIRGFQVGFLGLSASQKGQSTSPEEVDSWLQNIMPRLKVGVFTTYFSTSFSDRTDLQGGIDFGFIDESRYEGDIGYADLDPSQGGDGQWVFKVDGQELADGSAASTKGWYSKIDTMAGNMTLPRKVAEDYLSQIPGSTYNVKLNKYTFPCSADLPDFTFVIGDFKGIIAGSVLKNDPFDGSDKCFSKLMTTGDGEVATWGREFLQEFLVVFDWDAQRIGFGNKPGTKSSSSGPASASATNRASSSATDSTAPTHRSVSILWVGFSLLIGVMVLVI